MSAAPPLRHLLLALAVVTIWGTNFALIKVALVNVPPLMFGTLRFALAAIPAVFFIRRPAVPWRNLAAYGLFIGVMQFGVLYYAMNGHISPGIASLVIQMQVFFTIGFAIVNAGERVAAFQWLALLLSVTGIALIGLHTDGATSVLGVALVLLAALGWTCGNLTAKRAGSVDMLGYVAWSSLFSAPVLFVLSLLLDGAEADLHWVRTSSLSDWAAILWQSTGNTLFGYAAWAWLLARHPAASIVPMALLVPVIGMSTAALTLGEPMPGWKVAATAMVLAGLAINILWPRWRARMVIPTGRG